MLSQISATWFYVRSHICPVERERGDVPGWVLITLMTAGIVMALWVVAEPSLRNLLNNALNITGDPNK